MEGIRNFSINLSKFDSYQNKDILFEVEYYIFKNGLWGVNFNNLLHKFDDEQKSHLNIYLGYFGALFGTNINQNLDKLKKYIIKRYIDNAVKFSDINNYNNDLGYVIDKMIEMNISNFNNILFQIIYYENHTINFEFFRNIIYRFNCGFNDLKTPINFNDNGNNINLKIIFDYLNNIKIINKNE